MKHFLSVLAFMITSFGVQGTSHFAINKDHYAGVEFMRAEPIIPLGILTMIIQGLVLTFALARLAPTRPTIQDGVTVSIAFGLFLASYIVLVEPSKFTVPSTPKWMIVEGLASLIQFAIFGLALGAIHKKWTHSRSSEQ